MKKIVLYSAVTIDGLIARKDGGVDWLDAFVGDPGVGDYGYGDFIASVDTTIMGYETYRTTVKLDGLSSMAGFRNYVLTRRKDRAPSPRITFISENIHEFLREMKKGDGGNIWLLGGGQVNSLLLHGGLIDEMVLTVVPIILGDGVPLFAQPAPESAFILRSTRSYSNGLLQSVYEVSPSASQAAEPHLVT